MSNNQLNREESIMQESKELSQETQPRDIFTEITHRLAHVALVLEREHTWLKPKVDVARNEFEEEFKSGFRVEDERGWDDLYLKSSQVDTHLKNIMSAAKTVGDIAESLPLMLRVQDDQVEREEGAAA